jgi:tRNA pseudouridine55 synthase
MKMLTDQDVGDLRQGRAIGMENLLAPDWPLPAGFPDPLAPIRGFHLDKFCFLLTPREGRLELLTALSGGL